MCYSSCLLFVKTFSKLLSRMLQFRITEPNCVYLLVLCEYYEQRKLHSSKRNNAFYQLQARWKTDYMLSLDGYNELQSIIIQNFPFLFSFVLRIYSLSINNMNFIPFVVIGYTVLKIMDIRFFVTVCISSIYVSITILVQ